MKQGHLFVDYLLDEVVQFAHLAEVPHPGMLQFDNRTDGSHAQSPKLVDAEPPKLESEIVSICHSFVHFQARSAGESPIRTARFVNRQSTYSKTRKRADHKTHLAVQIIGAFQLLLAFSRCCENTAASSPSIILQELH